MFSFQISFPHAGAGYTSTLIRQYPHLRGGLQQQQQQSHQQPSHTKTWSASNFLAQQQQQQFSHDDPTVAADAIFHLPNRGPGYTLAHHIHQQSHFTPQGSPQVRTSQRHRNHHQQSRPPSRTREPQPSHYSRPLSQASNGQQHIYMEVDAAKGAYYDSGYTEDGSDLTTSGSTAAVSYRNSRGGGPSTPSTALSNLSPEEAEAAEDTLWDAELIEAFHRQQLQEDDPDSESRRRGGRKPRTPRSKRGRSKSTDQRLNEGAKEIDDDRPRWSEGEF